jgi:hypothetical protein
MRLITTLFVAACVVSSPVLAEQVDLGSRSMLEAVRGLKPGQYVWAPNAAPEGPALLVVNLATQRAVLFRNGVPMGASTISSGKKGYETPTGVFTVLEKKKEHYSKTYGNAPMPNVQRLTWKGVALHAGNLPGFPASHGCIRLPIQFSSLLFGATKLGMTVIITSLPVAPDLSATPELAGQTAAMPTSLAHAAYEWHPERATSGPVSVIVSSTDQRAIVLRNGQNRVLTGADQRRSQRQLGPMPCAPGTTPDSMAQASIFRGRRRHGGFAGRRGPLRHPVGFQARRPDRAPPRQHHHRDAAIAACRQHGQFAHGHRE